MEIKLKDVFITGMQKRPFKDADGEDLTLKNAMLYALLSPVSKNTSVEDALKIKRLFDKIDTAEDVVDLKSEEIVKIKEVVVSTLSAFISGCVISLLEG